MRIEQRDDIRMTHVTGNIGLSSKHMQGVRRIPPFSPQDFDRVGGIGAARFVAGGVDPCQRSLPDHVHDLPGRQRRRNCGTDRLRSSLPSSNSFLSDVHRCVKRPGLSREDGRVPTMSSAQRRGQLNGPANLECGDCSLLSISHERATAGRPSHGNRENDASASHYQVTRQCILRGQRVQQPGRPCRR